MTRVKRSISAVVAASVLLSSAWSTAQAASISTQEFAAAQAAESGLPDASAARAQIDAALARADLQAALAEKGVNLDQVRARVAALTDDEAQLLAVQIDQAPAGASDVLGVLVFLFVLLLVTDILGLTKVFPFTRSVRR